MESIYEDSENIVATKMELSIIYEDDDFLILDKPANIVIHPTQRHYDNSLSNGVKFYFNETHLHRKIRPVTRLDKDTTGITIFAKSAKMQEALIQQMKQNTFQKFYIGIVSRNTRAKERDYLCQYCKKRRQHYRTLRERKRRCRSDTL